MKVQTLSCLLSFALFALAATARADEKTTSPSAAQFDALKALAGDWVQIGKDGKPSDQVVSSIRLTASGSVVQETLFPGTDHEMVTMYHRDGADLVLTHYCVLGNQPRLCAEPGQEANRLAFKCIGGTNLKSEDEHHMHQATLNIVDKDHFESEWVSSMEGKRGHTANFDLVRKPK